MVLRILLTATSSNISVVRKKEAEPKFIVMVEIFTIAVKQ